jgi:WD40 repeat protein
MSHLSMSRSASSARRWRGALILGAVLVLILSACSSSNTTAKKTPTATTPGPTATPKPGTAYAYAFARGDEIWVTQPGKDPKQVSTLPSTGLKITSLAWSPDGKHLAFERSGAGNPVDYAMDVSDGSLVTLDVPSTTAAATLGWSDNKTVVVVKYVSDTATQIWKEDITTQESSQIIQLGKVGQVEIRNQSFYYALVDSNSKQLMLHRYDINLGSEGTPDPITPAGDSLLSVNWDVSPDGAYVAMGFKLATPDPNWDNGFWYIQFSDNTNRGTLFSEIPFDAFKSDNPITLTFSPDGQTVLLTTKSGPGPATEMVDGTEFHQYKPAASVISQNGVSWAPNGASFALSSSEGSGKATIYVLNGSSDGTALADNAGLLQWAPKS